MWRLFIIISTLASAICFPTTPPTTIRCKYNGKWYNPRETIYRGQSGNWCYSAYCGDDGNVIHADDFNCMTTLPTTTIPTTSRRLGCEYNGRWYKPDELISSGRSGNWCYYEYCGYGGNIINADDFNCKTTPPTTTIPTTPRRPGCEYNGRWYKPDELISSGRSGNWCYYEYCGYDGHIIHGDDFNCMTTLPTTTNPTTTP